MIGPRWKLIHLVMAIAVLGASFAAIGVAATAFGLVLLTPSTLATSGKRLLVAAWSVATGPPLSYVFSHYLTWVIVCWREGGRPMWISDPYLLNTHNTPMIRAILATIEVEAEWILFSMPATIVIALLRVKQTWKNERTALSNAAPVFSLPLLWILCFSLLTYGPREISNWFID